MKRTMEWKTIAVSDLKPASYNPRKQLKAGDKEYEKIKNSIQEFGYVEPIIVNYDMTVIGGHQRLTVLKDLGYTEVQCVEVHIEDENKVKALNVALNKITGAWNEELLAGLLIDLQNVDFNVDLTGFEPPEIEQLMSKVHNKDIKDDDFYKFLFCAFTNMEQNMENDASIYVFHADTQGYNFRRAFQDAGFYLSGCCIWKKNCLVLGRSPYQWQHEPCLFGWKKGGKHQWYSDRKQTTIWEYDRPKSSKEHPTMKPIPLMAYPIKNSSMSNCIVLEPFCGSGSTLLACEETNRICYGIELDEKFVDVIVKRYIKYFEDKGEQAKDIFVIRNGEKLTFDKVFKSSEVCENE